MKTFACLIILTTCSLCWGQDIKVEIAGPAEVESGGFALTGTAQEGAVTRWRIEGPEESQEPLKLTSADGQPVLVFLNPDDGRYVVIFSAQVPSDGLDPFWEARHVTVVGDGEPDPKPPGPGPEPDLTGIAKAVYEAAQGVDTEVVTTAAQSYQGQVQAIAAGEYDSLSIPNVKRTIATALDLANDREDAPQLFDAIDGELQKAEASGGMDTLPGISAVLSEVVKGLGQVAPLPIPPPTPNNLTAKVKELSGKVNSATKANEAAALKALYDQLASRYAAGGMTFEELLPALKEGHADAVGPSVAAWLPVFKLLADELTKAAGDNAKIADVLNQFSAGL